MLCAEADEVPSRLPPELGGLNASQGGGTFQRSNSEGKISVA